MVQVKQANYSRFIILSWLDSAGNQANKAKRTHHSLFSGLQLRSSCYGSSGLIIPGHCGPQTSLAPIKKLKTPTSQAHSPPFKNHTRPSRMNSSNTLDITTWTAENFDATKLKQYLDCQEISSFTLDLEQLDKFNQATQDRSDFKLILQKSESLRGKSTCTPGSSPIPAIATADITFTFEIDPPFIRNSQ